MADSIATKDAFISSNVRTYYYVLVHSGRCIKISGSSFSCWAIQVARSRETQTQHLYAKGNQDKCRTREWRRGRGKGSWVTNAAASAISLPLLEGFEYVIAEELIEATNVLPGLQDYMGLHKVFVFLLYFALSLYLVQGKSMRALCIAGVLTRQQSNTEAFFILQVLFHGIRTLGSSIKLSRQSDVNPCYTYVTSTERVRLQGLQAAHRRLLFRSLNFVRVGLLR